MAKRLSPCQRRTKLRKFSVLKMFLKDFLAYQRQKVHFTVLINNNFIAKEIYQEKQALKSFFLILCCYDRDFL